jgi:hypothetical protein
METLTPSSSDEMGSLCLSVHLEQDGRESLLPSRIQSGYLPPSFLFLRE